MLVVYEGVVAVAPRELLIAQTQVSVGDERRPPVLGNVLVVLPLLLHGVPGYKGDSWQRDEERDFAPQIGRSHSMLFLSL